MLSHSRTLPEDGVNGATIDQQNRSAGAGMAELADARGLGPRAARRAGSSPVPGTISGPFYRSLREPREAKWLVVTPLIIIHLNALLDLLTEV